MDIFSIFSHFFYNTCCIVVVIILSIVVVVVVVVAVVSFEVLEIESRNQLPSCGEVAQGSRAAARTGDEVL